MQTTDTSNFFRSEADLAAEEARARKAERTKDIGNPLELKGKVIRLIVQNGEAWTAESGAVVCRTNLATGRTIQVYRGHTGPVTCLAFFKSESGQIILLSGAWDQTIRVWDAETGTLLSTTQAHSDFLKTLLVIPHLNLLVSGSSDKHIKLWDLTVLNSPTTHATPLVQIGSTTGHTRPVECLAVDASTHRLFSADSMGVIKAWEVESHPAPTPSRRLTHVGDLRAHSMGVTDMWVAHGRVWSASTDNTVRVQSLDKPAVPSLVHTTHVRSLLPLHLTPAGVPAVITGSAAGGLHIWDVEASSSGDGDDPASIDGSGARESGLVDVHWHDVSALALWIRHPGVEGEVKELPTVKSAEAWIVSGSLDGTLRRWRLPDLLDGKHNTSAESDTPAPVPAQKPAAQKSKGFAMTEEEERELAELMSDEDS